MKKEKNPQNIIDPLLIEVRKEMEETEESLGMPIIALFSSSSDELPGEISYPAEYFIAEQLRKIKERKGLSDEEKIPQLGILLSSKGGNFPTVLNIVKLIKENCERFSIIVPGKALSAVSLLALMGDELIGSKDSVFSPFDPRVNNFTNPKTPTVSVSDIIAILSQNCSYEEKAASLLSLYKNTDPIVMAQALRARNQIKSALLERLKEKKLSEETIENLLNLFLENDLPHNSLLTISDIKESGMEVTELSEENSKKLKRIVDLLADYSLPVRGQQLLDFYKKSSSCFLNFSLTPILTFSADGGLKSIRRDAISTYCGDREKVSLPAISIQLSMPFDYSVKP